MREAERMDEGLKQELIKGIFFSPPAPSQYFSLISSFSLSLSAVLFYHSYFDLFIDDDGRKINAVELKKKD